MNLFPVENFCNITKIVFKINENSKNALEIIHNILQMKDLSAITRLDDNASQKIPKETKTFLFQQVKSNALCLEPYLNSPGILVLKYSIFTSTLSCMIRGSDLRNFWPRSEPKKAM